MISIELNVSKSVFNVFDLDDEKILGKCNYILMCWGNHCFLKKKITIDWGF